MLSVVQTLYSRFTRVESSQEREIPPIEEALYILETFGRRYHEHFRKRNVTYYDETFRVFCEIQRNLERGNRHYGQITHPETGRFYRHFSEQLNHYQLFDQFVKQSYSLRFFPQTILLHPKDVALEVLDEVERERSHALELIQRVLSAESDADARLSLEEKNVVQKHYFSSVMLIRGKSFLFLGEMIHLWGAMNHRNRIKQSKLLVQFDLRKWVENLDVLNTVCPDLLESRMHDLDFKSYLIECSMVAIREQIGSELSPLSVNLLKMAMTESESLRSDLSCFLENPESCLDLCSTNVMRPSSRFLRAFKLWFDLSKIVHKKFTDQLLAVLLHAENLDPALYKTKLQHRDGRFFLLAWHSFISIVYALHYKETGDAITFEKLDQQLSHPDSWELLYFLWKEPDQVQIHEFVKHLIRLPRCVMTLKNVLEICKENKIAAGSKRKTEAIDSFFFLIQDLDKKGLRLENTAVLFTQPVMNIGSFFLILERTERIVVLFEEIEAASGRSWIFRDYVQAFPVDFSKILRINLMNMQIVKFILIKDCVKAGIELTKDLILEGLGKSFEEFPYIPRQSQYTSALELTQRIHEIYRFSSVQFYSIYVEIIRLTLAQRNGSIRKISQIVQGLNEFCPALSLDIIYHLFRYHPDLETSQIDELFLLRKEWFKSLVSQTKFLVSPQSYEGIIAKIEMILQPVAENALFFNEMKEAILSGFLPPIQPLYDFFKKGTPAVLLQGELKPIAKDSDLAVYLNWSIVKNQPTLYFSFYDFKKKKSYGAFIPMGITIAEIEPVKERFWALHLFLAQFVLQEVMKIGDDFEDWARKPQIRKDLSDFEPVTPKWDFFRELILSYRKLFLAVVSDQPIEEFSSYEPSAVASLGHIYTSHERGSLLPHAIFHIESKPNYYTPDATLEFVEGLRARFFLNVPEFCPLELDMDTLYGIFPIDYQVNEGYVTLRTRSLDPITLYYPREVLDDKEKFLSYFDYQNLVLKSAYYYSMR